MNSTSEQRKQQAQRPWGRTTLGVFRKGKKICIKMTEEYCSSEEARDEITKIAKGETTQDPAGRSESFTFRTE